MRQPLKRPISDGMIEDAIYMWEEELDEVYKMYKYDFEKTTQHIIDLIKKRTMNGVERRKRHRFNFNKIDGLQR